MSSNGKKQVASGTVSYDPSQYNDVDYTTISVGCATPTADAIPEINKEFYGYGTGAYNGSLYNITGQVAPSVTKYGEYKASLKRKFLDVGSNRFKKPEAIAEYDESGNLAMFVGRDPSYPEELNKLIHPAQCDLCNMKMNSMTSAKDHYESKAHDKNITQWLTKNFADKGLPVPDVQRFYKHGPAGPDAFYCEVCDLKLTSLTHAEQHYAGKRHRLVISQRAKPSGEGFYNNEGKWVRISSKLVPKSDSRFGIGEQFTYAEILAKTGSNSTQSPDKTTEIIQPNADENQPKPAKIPKVDENNPTLFCAVCRVSVTSALQMTMHLSGTKHQKKLKASGVEVTNTGHPSASIDEIIVPIVAVSQAAAIPQSLLDSVINEDIPDPADMSKYRTPSGQYYCQSCNLTITNLHALEQHLSGKRHLRSQVEKKAVAALSGKAK